MIPFATIMKILTPFVGCVLTIMLLVGLAVMILKIVDRLTLGRKQSPEKRAESIQIFNQRLLNPDFESLRQHFDHPIPQSLISLYENHDLIVQGGFSVIPRSGADDDEMWYIASFEPMDAESQEYTFFDSLKYLAFAGDGCGNAYVVDPRDDDPAVLFHDHEDDDFSQVCDRLSLFLTWPRESGEG